MKARLLMDFRRAAEWCMTDRRLRLIIEDLAAVWPAQFMSISSIHRTLEEELEIEEKIGRKTSRIHTVDPPYRAVDIATGEWNQQAIRLAVDKVNAEWIYDPARPEKLVLLYRPHGTGPHVHAQVHPATRSR